MIKASPRLVSVELDFLLDSVDFDGNRVACLDLRSE